MDIQELASILTEGLSAEDSQKIRATIERENTKAKVAALKTHKDLEALQAQADKVTELERELDYIDPQGNPRGYRAWYQRYKDEVFDKDKMVREYESKYGVGSLAKALQGQLPNGQTTQTTQPQWTKDDFRRELVSAVQEIYAPMWSNLLTTTNNLTQKHLLAGRKNPLDLKALEEIARSRHQGNLEAAYDEWDKPERDRLAKEAVEKDKKDREEEIQRRVAEELAKRNVPQYFPTGADLTPSSLSQRSDEAVKGFDKSKFTNDLATTFYNAGQERAA